MKNFVYDAIIIGGGFYGSIIALFLKKKFKNVVILEKESDLLLNASCNNQARIHNGYHYPRSIVTAIRSHENYARFIKDFKPAVDSNYTMVYAIAKNNSKITSTQFIKFCKQIGSPLTPVPQNIKELFNDQLIEDVFLVQEDVFNISILRKLIKKKLKKNAIPVSFNHEVFKISSKTNYLSIKLKNNNSLSSKVVFNCTYANSNKILSNSSIPLLPLKHELAEMPLIKLPFTLSNLGITIIDGPFFSIMPYPSKNLHTIHHVRYTPHATKEIESKFIYMLKDIKRYLPSIESVVYKKSLYETKTILKQSEITDSRPILFRKHHGFKNFHVIMGGKIDNIYDILEELKTVI